MLACAFVITIITILTVICHAVIWTEWGRKDDSRAESWERTENCLCMCICTVLHWTLTMSWRTDSCHSMYVVSHYSPYTYVQCRYNIVHTNRETTQLRWGWWNNYYEDDELVPEVGLMPRDFLWSFTVWLSVPVFACPPLPNTLPSKRTPALSTECLAILVSGL